MDDLSGKTLVADLVQEARRQEIDIIRQMGVWEVAHRPEGIRVIGTRWADINKGDDKSPNYRSRLVAKDIRTGGPQEHFAAMPPLAALRFLVSLRRDRGLAESRRQADAQARAALPRLRGCEAS